jgi:ABC-type cobalamin/Fe3+-siderophores transport system ATPase subunit
VRTGRRLPPSKEAIVEEVCEAIHEHAQVLLVGEPGAGKTCVLRAVRHRLPQAGFRLTYCHHATLGRRDFYRQLSHALGLDPAATAAAVFYAVSVWCQCSEMPGPWADGSESP